MRTAADVARRIMWDPTVARSDFIVGYLDRFRGVLEKSFDDFNWGKLEMAGHFDLAIPQHRIQYFKYRGYIVWEKATRIDRIFGSTPPYDKITDVQAQMEQGKIRVAGMAVGEEADGSDDASDDGEGELKLEEDSGAGGDEQQKMRFAGNDRPNYFVSFKISDSSTVARLLDVQREVVRKDPRLEVACLPAACFHVTLVTLQLRNEDEIEAARVALLEAKELLHTYLARDVRLTIAGLECFRQRVLHARVAEHGRLQSFVHALKQVFKTHRLRLAGNHEPFTAHVTLIKLNREMCRNSVASIDDHLWGAMRGLRFGLQPVEAVHLCKMTASEKDEVTGFYKCVRTITNSQPVSVVTAAVAAQMVLDACQKQQVLVVLRGVPGAGKSTLTASIENALHGEGLQCAVASADHYFMKDGVYEYRKDEIQAAHDACRQSAEAALAHGFAAVLIDNTNTQLVAYERYLSLARAADAMVIIVDCHCASQSQAMEFCRRGVHNVDPDACIAMWQRWQPDPRAILVGTAPTEAIFAENTDCLNPLYLGVLLTEESQQLLLSKVRSQYPAVKAHHVTLRFRPSVEQLLAAPLGQECAITVRTIASDGYCQAAIVGIDQNLLDHFAGDDCTPHITISHVRGVKPVYALDMILKTPGAEVHGGEFQLTGVVGALVRVADGEPVTLAAPQDLAWLLNRHSSTGSSNQSSSEHFARRLLPEHLKLQTIEHLHVFDFDNTIVQTPSRADYETVYGRKWQGRGWWAHPDSLDDALPFRNASGMQLLLEKAGRPNSATIILTGRIDPLQEDVRRVLQRFGVENLIDAIICKPPDRTPTAEYKRETMRQLLQLLPSLKTATVWDDDAENMVEMSHLQEAFPACKLEIFSCLHLSQACASHIPNRQPAALQSSALHQWASANHLLTAELHCHALTRTLDIVANAWREVHPAGATLGLAHRVYGSTAYHRQSDVDLLLCAGAEVDKKDLLQRLGRKLAAAGLPDVAIWTYFANSNRCPRINALFLYDDFPVVDLDIVVTETDLERLESTDLATHPELLGLAHLEQVTSKIGDALSMSEFGALLCAVCRVFEQAHALHAPYLFTVRTFQIAQLLAEMIAAGPIDPVASSSSDVDIVHRYFRSFVCQMADNSMSQWRQLFPVELVAECHLLRISAAFQACEQRLQTKTVLTATALEDVLQAPLASPLGYTGRVTISLAGMGASFDETEVFQAYNGVTGLLHKYIPRIAGEGVSVAAGPTYRRLAFKRPISFCYNSTGAHIAEIVQRHMDSFMQEAHANGYVELTIEVI